MPALYAHRRFGEDVLAMLEEPLKSQIAAHLPAFFLGTQGPDILFNHKPLKSNPISKKGMDMHLASAKEFFTRCYHLTRDCQDVMRAYVAGFICHFCLDNACHPHVYFLENQGFSHARIESELDKYAKGVYGDEIFQNAGAFLTKKDDTAKTCATVLEVDEKAVCRSIKTMRRVNALFSCKNKALRRLAKFVLKKAKKDKFWDMFLQTDNLPETDALCPTLYEDWKNAVLPTKTCIEKFFGTVDDDFFKAFDKDYKGDPIV